jgi:hypothetical protein
MNFMDNDHSTGTGVPVPTVNTPTTGTTSQSTTTVSAAIVNNGAMVQSALAAAGFTGVQVSNPTNIMTR